MTVAVDTSVLLDILIPDTRFGDESTARLRECRDRGRIICCEVAIAEISPVFSDQSDLMAFMDEIGLEFVPLSRDAALLSGSMYAKYLRNKGGAKRVLPDFLVAAHSLSLGASLLARDRGYYREYFKDLHVIDPSASTSK